MPYLCFGRWIVLFSITSSRFVNAAALLWLCNIRKGDASRFVLAQMALIV